MSNTFGNDVRQVVPLRLRMNSMLWQRDTEGSHQASADHGKKRDTCRWTMMTPDSTVVWVYAATIVTRMGEDACRATSPRGILPAR